MKRREFLFNAARGLGSAWLASKLNLAGAAFAAELLRDKQRQALHYALGLGLLDAFTIGATNKKEQTDLIQRIAAA